MDTLSHRRSFSLTSTNLCKGIAIILMYFHHSFYDANSWSECEVIFAPLTQNQTIYLALLGKVCVHIFVLLSAFGTYRSTPPDRTTRVTYPQTVKRRYLHLAGSFLLIYLLTQIFSSVISSSRLEVYGADPLARWFYTVVDALGLAVPLGTPSYNATWWYMYLAMILIFLLPLLSRLVDRIGWTLLPLTLLLIWGLKIDASSDALPRYLPVAVTGILLAKYQVFERVYDFLSRRIGLLLLGIPVLLVLMACTGYLRSIFGLDYILLSLLAVWICFFCFLYLEQIPGLRQVLYFLGKHSMNMFLTHSLIRNSASKLHAFSYAPKYPILIILLLLADTLLLSIAIEGLKKLLGFLWSNMKLRFNDAPSSSSSH